jgi:hypothetical protein
LLRRRAPSRRWVVCDLQRAVTHWAVPSQSWLLFFRTTGKRCFKQR